LKSKRRLLILGLGLTGLLALPAAAADPAAAKATVDTVVAEALAALRDDSLTQPQKQDRIEKLAEQRFDFPVITKLVLARNWKKLSEDQRAEFLVEFKRHLSLTYGRRLGRFSDEDVVVGDTQGHSNGDVTVKTSIVGGEANGVTLDYRMRERDGNWYAIDVIIEGVSMISNFRSQIQEIVSTSGPEGLINALREKNEAEAAEPADT
jgi:phospholipid transport system substrate-binding protein